MIDQEFEHLDILPNNFMLPVEREQSFRYQFKKEV